MPNDHALLAPSASARWIACPPSARLEAQVPEKDTVYTREGTIAHAMAEAILKGALKSGLQAWPDDYSEIVSIGGPDLLKCYNQAEGERLDPSEMMQTVSDNYCRIVYEDYLTALQQDPEADLLIEQKFKLSDYVPEGFGSSDAVILYKHWMSVYDLKYGKGVKVSATNNPQMMCYALGALLGPGELTDPINVEMNIVQPRLHWVSTWAITTEHLLSWAEEILRPAAVEAYQGGGAFHPGDHCKFCAVAPRCKSLALQASSMNLDKAGALMTDEEISKALKSAGAVKAWIASLEAYALDRALEGHTVPGWKVVEGRSVRQITDQESAMAALNAAGLSEVNYCKPKELRNISDLERLLTKKGFNAMLGQFVTKTTGKPTLVEESDPRPAMGSTSSAVNDFKEVQL